MTYFDDEIKKYAQKTRLKASERSELRERIFSYMEYHPLPKDMQSLEKVVREPMYQVVLQHVQTLQHKRIIAGVFAVLLVITAVPFAAEEAVPGDVLYPVKTTLNEGVRASLANSPYEQVSFETELLERRIAEARLLAKEGKLTEEVEAAIAEDVKEHADAAQKGIANLKEQDADAAAIAEIAFGSVLEVQSAMLGSDRGEEATGGLVGAMREVQENATAERGTSTPSYNHLLERLEQETGDAYERFAALNDYLSPEERTNVETRLATIERKIEEAKNIHEAGVSGDGVTELTATFSSVRKLISFLTDIDVRETIALETLMPVELTVEERFAVADATLESVTVRWNVVEAKLAATDNASTTEAAAANVAHITELLETASSSRVAEDIDAFEAAVEGLQAPLTALETLTADISLAPKETEEEVETEDDAGEDTASGTSAVEEGE